METAVEWLMIKGNPLLEQMRAAFSEFLTAEELKDNAALREASISLLHASPLHLNSLYHSLFWYHLCKFHDQFFANAPEESNQFVIILNGDEAELKLSYNRAIFLLLRVLFEESYQFVLHSFHSLPYAITAAFCRRGGLRTYLLQRVLRNVYDLSNLPDLYTMSGSMPSEESIVGFHYNLVNELGIRQTTPEQEVNSLIQTVTFPQRKSPCIWNQVAEPEHLEIILAIYRLLWNEVRELVPSFETLSENHGDMCRCRRSLLSMETCMPLLQAIVERSFDLKTLSHEAAHILLNADLCKRVLTVVCGVADQVRDFLAGTKDVPALRYLLDSVSSSSQIPQLLQARPSKPVNWHLLAITKLPLRIFLEVMDLHYAVPYWSVKVRKFLEGKSRSIYVAYALPPEASFADLELTLSKLQGLYGQFWPSFFHSFCTAKMMGRSYLIAQPHLMLGLRLLTLTHSMLQDRQPPALCSSVFLHMYLANFKEGGGTLKPISQYALAVFLARLLGHNPAQVALPGTGRFQLYARLSKLLNYGFPQNQGVLDWMLTGSGAIELKADFAKKLLNHWMETGMVVPTETRRRFTKAKPGTIVRMRTPSIICELLTSAFQIGGLQMSIYETEFLAEAKFTLAGKLKPEYFKFTSLPQQWPTPVEEEVEFVERHCEHLNGINCFKQNTPRAIEYAFEVVQLCNIEHYLLAYNINPKLGETLYQQLISTLYICEANFYKRKYGETQFYATTGSLTTANTRRCTVLDANTTFESSLYLCSTTTFSSFDQTLPKNSTDLVVLDNAAIESLACQFNTPWCVPEDPDSSATYVEKLRHCRRHIQPKH